MATIVLFPDAGTSSNTCDGRAQRITAASGEAFSTIRNGAGTTVDTTAADDAHAQLQCGTTVDQFQNLGRGIYVFPSYLIGGGSIISTATFSLFGSGKNGNIGTSDLDLAGATLASYNNVLTSDFANVGRTLFGAIAYASYSIVAYNDITLNATGIAAINLTTPTAFSTQLDYDLTNSFTGTWLAGQDQEYYLGKYADSAGTVNDPKLTVTYTGNNKPGNYGFFLRVGNGMSRSEGAS